MTIAFKLVAAIFNASHPDTNGWNIVYAQLDLATDTIRVVTAIPMPYKNYECR